MLQCKQISDTFFLSTKQTLNICVLMKTDYRLETHVVNKAETYFLITIQTLDKHFIIRQRQIVTVNIQLKKITSST